MQETYEKLYQRKPLVNVIHAGLECGIIQGVFPDMDMISFGPDIKFPHSPDEAVHIGSVQKTWDFLIEILAAAKTTV
jgi:dipeptidase D